MWQLQVCAPGGESTVGLKRREAAAWGCPHGCVWARSSGLRAAAHPCQGPVKRAASSEESSQWSLQVESLANGALFWQMFAISGGGRDVGGRGLHPVLEAAGEMWFSCCGGNSRAWCFAGTNSVCWMKWVLSYSRQFAVFSDLELSVDWRPLAFPRLSSPFLPLPSTQPVALQGTPAHGPVRGSHSSEGGPWWSFGTLSCALCALVFLFAKWEENSLPYTILSYQRGWLRVWDLRSKDLSSSSNFPRWRRPQLKSSCF